MKTKNYQIILLMTIAISLSLKLFPQSGSLTLSFSGDNNGQPVSLESVWVKNLTQNCDTTLYPPELTLVIDTLMTNTENLMESENNFSVSQNYPNPFTDQTTISVYIPEKDKIEIRVSNLLGQQLAVYSTQLNSGNNTFRFFPGKDRVYLMSVNYKMTTITIRLLYSGDGNMQVCKLRYEGNEDHVFIKSIQSKNYFDFNPGDQLLFVGYTFDDESGILDSPSENKDYIFQFATNIPCPGLDSLEYEGQYYHTIQIFSQCWMKENLNVGTWINSSQPQTNNNIIEKYCMADMQYGCDVFGGIYFWNEMMEYTNTSGGKGICPDGWHIPEDIEWQILEGAVDSLYGIGNDVWNYNGWRGINAGGNLKQKGNTWWMLPNTGATDAFGFCTLPAGYYVQNEFWGPEYKTYLWSSHYPTHYFRNMDFDKAFIARGSGGNDSAISVRCVKN